MSLCIRTFLLMLLAFLFGSCLRPVKEQGGCDPYMTFKADDQAIVEFDTMSYRWNEIDTVYIKRYDSMGVSNDSTIWTPINSWYLPNVLAASAFDEFHYGKSTVKYYELKIKGQAEIFIFRDFRVFRFKPQICSEKSIISEVTINNTVTGTFPFLITK